jgi:hypothetical protein
LQMRKERRQEFNVHRQSQVIIAYQWMSIND